MGYYNFHTLPRSNILLMLDQPPVSSHGYITHQPTLSMKDETISVLYTARISLYTFND